MLNQIPWIRSRYLVQILKCREMTPHVEACAKGGASAKLVGAVAGDRPPLTSWKDIAAYLQKSERTVQRWEKEEGLPVRRLPSGKNGTVYAHQDELDQWLRSRPAESVPEPVPEPTVEASVPQAPQRRIRLWWIAAAVVGAIFGAASISYYSRTIYARSSHTGVQTLTLTSYSGTESCPTFSPDGKRVAFVWTRPDGSTPAQPNVYVMNVGDAKPFRLTDRPEPEMSPVWSPDGKTVALLRLTGADQVSLVLKPVAGGAERVVTNWRAPAVPFWEQAARIRHLDWTPDGRSLIVSAPPSDEAPGDSRRLFVLSLASGERRAITHAPASAV
jgi:Tol biopolymer transport system component